LSRPSPIVRYGRYGALAFEFTGTIGAGAFFGWLLDRWLGSEPWALVAGTLLAVTGGFIRLVQLVKRLERHDLGGQP
jgi:F0F1-type ATP synthase assembly protein I